MPLNLSAEALMAGMLVSSIGCGLFMYGKREGRAPQLVGGIALIAFPMVVESPALVLGIGALLVVGVVASVRAGF